MRFSYASDQTLLVTLGEEIALKTHRRLINLLRALEANPLEGVLNLHPAYASLLIKFDPCRTGHQRIEREIGARIPEAPEPACRRVEIPVCYGGAFGPDLESVSEYRGLAREEVIAVHSSATYQVYFLGFVPGFAYLGGLPDSIAAPRLPAPRKRVEPGSVGIAGNQSGVYPFATPGGWRLIGRTPLRMFSISRADRPALLSIGDEVRFRPIDPDEFRGIEAAQA